MKRALSPYSSSSSSSSRDESPRAIHSSRSHATASSSPKRRRLDHSYSRSHGSSRDRRRSAAGGNRRTSSCSSSSSDRSSRSSASSGHRERLERQKDVEPQQRLARRRSKAESSDSDNANSSDGMNGGSVRAADRPLTTTFDVERIPYDAPDHLDTLRPMTIADAIRAITENKYDELTKNRYDQPNTYSKDRMRKVLASIVMERKVHCGNNRLCIVSLGAGSKSIGGAFLTKEGDSVHDCHAEVLARRGLVRFMYSQLEEIKNGKEEKSIFKKDKDEMYALRNNVSFHLFISKPPCGDASVFGQHENHQNRKRRGIARVTPADGEGAIHISWPPENDDTFDKLKAGGRLHKMCCSAKIARWNVIGVQGSLLSLYIKPVYLSSITIGSQFHDGHLKRAVYGRVSKIQELPSHYHINDPKLYHVSSPDDTTEKSHKMSLNWYLHDSYNNITKPQIENGDHEKQLEAQVGTTTNRGEELIECQYGKPPTTDSAQNVSRLSKQELFKCFVSLWDSLASRTLKQRLPPGISTGHQLPYSTVKALAKSYQEAKEKVAKCFAGMPYGSRWLKMPPEVDKFSLIYPDNKGSEAGDNSS